MSAKNKIFDFIKEGIIITDENLTVKYYNKSFKTFCNSIPSKSKITNILSFQNMDKALSATKAEEVFETITPVYFSSNRVECRVIVFKDLYITWIFEDITSTKILKKAKADFVSAVSHEFMTPLSILQGFLCILKEEKLNKELKKKYIDRCLIQTSRLEKLIDQLLSLSELEMKKYTTNFQNVNLLKIIQESKNEMMYRWKSKNVNVKISCRKDLYVYTDPSALNRILTNLISNAIKYSYEKSTVEIFVNEKEKTVDISIKDYGIGIKEDEIPRIFERFYRASNSFETKATGMGLGLSLVKHLSHAIKVNIAVQSRFTFGSIFTIQSIEKAKQIILTNLSEKHSK